jgi:hypothetical protein
VSRRCQVDLLKEEVDLLKIAAISCSAQISSIVISDARMDDHFVNAALVMLFFNAVRSTLLFQCYFGILGYFFTQ